VLINPFTINGTFKHIGDFDENYYYQKIVNSNKIDILLKDKKGMPKIAGTFSNWECLNLMPIDKFYDCLLRNSIPTRKYYVQKSSTILSKISEILNKDVMTMRRNMK
jgi:hypothetical protein